MKSRPRRLLGRAGAALALAALAAGCFPDTSGETPDPGSYYLYYPVGLGITRPEGSYLLAVNSNFDLQFNSGSVVPFDLEKVRDLVTACRSGEAAIGCAEFVVPTGDEAKDERFGVYDFVLEDHAVLIGSYAGGIAMTDDLALVPVRADASMTSVDVVEVPQDEQTSRRVLRCSDGQDADRPGSAQRCGAERTVRSGARLRDGAIVSLPSEPFTVHYREPVPDLAPDDAADCAGCPDPRDNRVAFFQGSDEDPGVCEGVDPDGWDEFLARSCSGLVEFDNRCGCGCGCYDPREWAVVGHMVGGQVSLFALRDGGVELVDVEDSFPEGTSGIAVDPYGRYLVSSRYQARVTSFYLSITSAVEDEHAQATVSPSRSIEVDAAAPAGDQRGVAISPSGERAYVVSREPASVMVLDISRNDGGEYADRFVDIIEVGPAPAIIRVLEHPALPDGHLVYVVCFAADSIYVIDPVARDIVDVIPTRRGPHDLVFDPELPVAYLANFLESTVSIIDVDPESDMYHRRLTTLGHPRRPRTND